MNKPHKSVQRKKYQKPLMNVYPVDMQGALLGCSNDDGSMCVIIVPRTHD